MYDSDLARHVTTSQWPKTIWVSFPKENMYKNAFDEVERKCNMVKLLPTLFKGSLTEVKGVLFETEKKYFQYNEIRGSQPF